MQYDRLKRCVRTELFVAKLLHGDEKSDEARAEREESLAGDALVIVGQRLYAFEKPRL